MSNKSITRDSISLMIYESLGLFGLSNSCVTIHRCSLMIYESLGAVWDVESIHQP
jgi:hypothetical protein